MALTQQQIQEARAKYGFGSSVTSKNNAVLNTGTAKDFSVAGKGLAAKIKDIPSDIAETGRAIAGDIRQGFKAADETVGQVMSGEVSPIAGTIKTIGEGVKAGARAVGELGLGAGKILTSPGTEADIAEGVQSAAQKVMSIDKVKRIGESYAALNPQEKAIVDGVLGGAEGLLAVLGLGQAEKGAVKAVSAGIKGAEKAASAASRAASSVAKAGESALEGATSAVSKIAESPIVGTVSEVAKGLGERVAKIPSNIAVNAAEKKAIRQSIDALPSKVAKDAASNGIDVADVNTIASIPKSSSKAVKELATVAEDFARGTGKTDPIELVGKPIVSKLKQLESQRSKIGSELGEVANNLPKVATKEAADSVFDALKEVPGLSGLKLSYNKFRPVLDFSDTVFQSSLTSAERASIEKVFAESVKSGTGKSKHLFRQELFEILGGKKRALTNLTDTEERAYEAVRKGLSNVLESKDPKYKKLSSQYRSVIQPLQDMRKALRVAGQVDDDILDMSAGLLARRLTSNAASNPQIRSLLRSLDKTGAKRATELSVETLQDAYNVLNKYYDIAGGTTFQGLNKAAIEGTGIMDIAGKALKDVAGQSAAVRQKALKDLIESL